MLVGLISDTHGYVDPRVASAFDGVEAILHAGDIGSAAVLEALALIAPTYAVEGNNDAHLAGLGLPLRLDIELADRRLHLVHQLPHAQPSADTDIVVYGHSHRSLIERRGDIVYINPGAAGRTGFHRLQTVALLELVPTGIATRIVELGPREALPRQRKQRVI